MDYTVTATGEGTDVVRLAGPTLQAAIDAAIAAIPPEKTFQAELLVTLEGIETSAAIRLFDNVEAGLFWQRKSDGKQAFGARARVTF